MPRWWDGRRKAPENFRGKVGIGIKKGWNQKGGPGPPLSKWPRGPVARAELSTPPGQKNYFFLAFLAFFAFFAFFAFLAIVSSQGFNG